MTRIRWQVWVTTAIPDGTPKRHLREDHLRPVKADEKYREAVADELKRLARGGGHVEGFLLSNDRCVLVRSEDGVPVQVSFVELVPLEELA